MTLLQEIQEFIKKTGISRSALGRLACNDPRLVNHLENGRQPKEIFKKKVRAFMASYTDDMAPKWRKPSPESRRSVRANQHIVRHRPIIVVDRDPCFRCNTRKDIGCEHHEPSQPVEII